MCGLVWGPARRPQQPSIGCSWDRSEEERRLKAPPEEGGELCEGLFWQRPKLQQSKSKVGSCGASRLLNLTLDLHLGWWP